MKVEFLASFEKDLSRIRQSKVKQAIEKIIIKTEEVDKLE